jgi:maltooligosyltrehalose trehalohydrolase
MLFQGEEWAASTPFQFFTSHPEEELGRATAEGRIEEFARHGWDPAAVPDPQDPATFERSKLDWSETGSERGRRMLGAYRELARLRREHPELTDPSFANVACRADEAARFFTMQRGALLVLVNFGGQPTAAEIGPAELRFETGSGVDVVNGVARLPAHAGALVRLGR